VKKAKGEARGKVKAKGPTRNPVLLVVRRLGRLALGRPAPVRRRE
jgi:hypothetical protein